VAETCRVKARINKILSCISDCIHCVWSIPTGNIEFSVIVSFDGRKERDPPKCIFSFLLKVMKPSMKTELMSCSLLIPAVRHNVRWNPRIVRWDRTRKHELKIRYGKRKLLPIYVCNNIVYIRCNVINYTSRKQKSAVETYCYRRIQQRLVPSYGSHIFSQHILNLSDNSNCN
jgi:hypothetical protein